MVEQGMWDAQATQVSIEHGPFSELIGESIAREHAIEVDQTLSLVWSNLKRLPMLFMMMVSLRKLRDISILVK